MTGRLSAACAVVAALVMLTWAALVAVLAWEPPLLSQTGTSKGVVLPGGVRVAGWARDAGDRAAGVLERPLDLGQSLVFVWPGPVSPTWTMRGVSYPLHLAAVSEAGAVLWSTVMPACLAATTCLEHQAPAGVEAATWIETRVLH